ncbi:uroporphyrinogen-III C-methyltransferase [Mycolicibacterium bacteremicum]|uniref:uroporphyrinogen-III C-methyltransferase n=1 Tax=Mycolicibacterium bacteremicum TaxID=564198 RepID=UPI000D6C90CD|nr:uroporphyrinogen-III C-methyltransferase [Mycolicibacterium bacteremicum]MCV7431717.1 uroporphyrinogen-III C-methyltransferase [Mycolicibacterium bacteremicum]
MGDGIAVRLPVRHRSVAVIGSSDRSLGIVGALLTAGANITVFAAQPAAYLADLADRGLITLRANAVGDADLLGAEVVFTCAGLGDAERATVAAAAARGTFCIDTEDDSEHAAGPDTGRVIIVGGGPGDPGLLTVAGRTALAGADVIVTDRLAPVAALHEIAPRAQVIDVSKIPGGRRTEQSDINTMLIEHARAGRTVVRLKGGDGFVFGRGGEEVDECVRAGVTVDVIPGVSSSIAVPASAMVPVTHRGLTQGFTVVSGHVPPDDPECTVNYAALAAANTTIVLMMAVANLDTIARTLMEAGMPPGTPAVVIADGTLAGQQEIRASLDGIAAAARDAEVRPPATTVIGAVAGFVPGQAVDAMIARPSALAL